MSRLLIFAAIILLAMPLTMYGQSVSLDHVSGLAAGRLPVGAPVSFYFRLANHMPGVTFYGMANGFRLYSPDGGSWEPWIFVDTNLICDPGPCTTFDTTWYGEWINSELPAGVNLWKGSGVQVFDGGLFIKWYSHDGQGSDTVGFAGYQQTTGVGIFPGFSGLGPKISIDSFPMSSAGMTFCIDSSYFLPSGKWLWADGVMAEPAWDGPHCWTIGEYCCVGIRGNLDLGDPGINIADLTALIRYMFGGGGGSDLQCPLAPNVNGDPGESVDISDLTYMIAYMFRGGPQPPPCP